MDTSLYNLTLKGQKVVSDVDYVVCIDIGEKDDYRILNFADVQLNSLDVESANEVSKFTFESMDSLVSKTKPDLLTHTGDQCYGDRSALMAVAERTASYGLKWAPIIGNHDCEQRDMDLEEQSRVYRSFENCLFKDGPSDLNHVAENNADSIGHYVVNLVRTKGESFRIIRSLIFMNTGSTQSYDGPEYQKVKRYGNKSYASLNGRQIDWYRQMVISAQRYGKGKPVPSGVYMHITPYVFVKAASEAFRTKADIFDVDSWLEETKTISYEDSFKPENWDKGFEESFGVAHELLAGAPYEDNFFDAVKELGSTDYIMSGHDHINSFNIRYKGVNLIYALKTGKGCYFDPRMMGGTVVTMTRDGKVSFRNELCI